MGLLILPNDYMKVSIVVPTYNRAEMLSMALQSILRQNYHKIEVIVVDDESGDATPNVVREQQGLFGRICGRETLQYIRQSRQGAPSARNAGFAYSTGDLVMFMDSDDLLTVGGLQAVMERAKEADADYFHAKVQEVDKDAHPLPKSSIGGPHEDGGDGLMDYSWHTMGAVYSRKCVERVGPWAITLTGSQDWEYQTRVKLFGGKGIFVDTVVGYWRQHDKQRLGTKAFRPEYVKSVQEACKLIISNAEKANRCDEALRKRIAKRLLVHAAEWGAHGRTQEQAECLELAKSISKQRASVVAACSLLRVSPQWCAAFATSVLAARRGD